MGDRTGVGGRGIGSHLYKSLYVILHVLQLSMHIFGVYVRPSKTVYLFSHLMVTAVLPLCGKELASDVTRCHFHS